MKVVSTNLAKPKTFEWNGKMVETGIDKYPVDEGVILGTHDVDGDVVIERKFHGGLTKSCYLYSQDHYQYWQEIYPDLDWHHGIFGENLTIAGLDETQLIIGAEYRIGEAIIQITEPRQPCYKFGWQMGDQGIIKKFIDTTYCGAYVATVQSGLVKSGDELILLTQPDNAASMAQVYRAIFDQSHRLDIKGLIESTKYLPKSLKEKLLK